MTESLKIDEVNVKNNDFLEKLNLAELRDEQKKFTYKKIAKIGNGAFSNVYSAVRNDGQHVACKIFTKPKNHKDSFNNFRSETYTLSNITLEAREFLVHMLECRIEKNNMIIVFPMARKTLYNFIHKNETMSIGLKSYMVEQLLNAGKCLKRLSIAHRDIKPENALLFDNHKLKICDFGISKVIKDDSKQKTLCGTLLYMAPELFVKNLNYNGMLSDVWSIGCVIYEILHKQSAFDGKSVMDLVRKIRICAHRPYHSKLHNLHRTLLNNCLVTNPSLRIKIDEIRVPYYVKK